MEKYPIFELTLAKDECRFATTAEIVAELIAKVEAHPIAKMIGHFDHYAHTQSIDGEINPDFRMHKTLFSALVRKSPMHKGWLFVRVALVLPSSLITLLLPF